ncbi:ABC transporter ATP-binding protein [Halosimplex aquaticum]|uniref:ABC-type D-xylose/L-arabinose transporter n=1 Tax=Halosimplex aquaticum TaxID=3026162 RepID=A0ABD5Y0B4_9EURY|nr:sn-glycerol-3-phosphate ABC transporter ATP-binding protein UgpC [Halosimplex aquaticum]
MANLSLEAATKQYGDGDEGVLAVDELDLDIESGEFLVLVGPSGCGKSTTLRMVAGLETLSDGQITLDEEVINTRTPQERDIAMVFQSYALYPHMTVRENMSFGLEESTDLPDDEIEELVEDAAETLGITPLLDRKPGDLSGGQQQRVALGRAIVRDPKVFLLDEPLANLDAKLRAEMRTELQQLQDELDTTTIYVTHDQTEAMTMSDRIAVLDGGELQQVGTPMECYHEPANQFVAGFIGEPSMNFFSTTREGDTLVGEHFEYDLSEETLADIGDAEDVVLGIRPENVEVGDGLPGEHVFDGVVDVVQPQGYENTVHLRFASQDEDADTLTATIDGMRALQWGEEVDIRIPEDAIHLFDGVTGEALHNRVLETVEKVEQIGTA